jgi:apolipoprotein N-acyltransferase
MRGFSTPMIFGNATQERFPAEGKVPVKHNTAMLMDGNGEVLGTYFKNRLLIFGEFIPFENLFPFLRKWLPEAGDWTPGEGPAIFTLGDAKIGISICYEGLLASFHRKLAALGPNVMINITNDAWFGKTHEPWLHLQLAELRTVETRTPMVRSTNTGISAFVDAVGRRVAHTGIEDAEYLVQDVPLTSENTIYVRYGDVFAWACCGLAAMLVVAGFIGRRRGGRA